jgi:16S rRNA (cytidine1402-2'-O)-methyltransferase
VTRGALILVGTPIGNLADLSPRAREALATADVIACEDTRRTGRLLELSGIGRRPLLVVNEHTEESRVREVVDRVGAGERVAIVTDAGMPGISDPGERLVRAVADAGLLVEVVPGPSAVVSALVASGLPAGRFVYEGFLPRKGSGRSARLRALADERRTAVLYEAPHRVAATLADLVQVCGSDRPVALVRELTKLHEEVWRGTLAAAVARVAEVEPRGEYVLVLGGAPELEVADDEAIRVALAHERSGGSSTKDAVAAVSELLGVPKRRVYELATRT